MASITLYPPNLSTTADAFVVDENYNGTCTVYYSLSMVSTIPVDEITGIHFTIYRQSTGASAVRCKDSTGAGIVERYRQTGIVMVNQPPQPVEGYDNLYYFTIDENDINGDEYSPHSGWTPGYIYKIQMRVSTVNYTDTSIGQSAWLVQNADKFSEWTTYCITKAISQPIIKIRTFLPYPEEEFGSDTLQFEGSYEYKDSNNSNELLYSYTLNLYQNDILIEDSGVQYFDRFSGSSVFNYTFKTKLINEQQYSVKLNYITVNKYTETCTYNFITHFNEDDTDVDIFVLESNSQYFKDSVSVYNEEETGRVGIVLYKEGGITGNYYIQRASCLDDFNTWEDIALLDIDISQNTTPIFYDYTIESGVWYKYAVQKVLGTTSVGYIRTPAKQIEEPILREFEYNFLVGENGQQLRLTFDGVTQNYQYTLSESNIETIGGVYPIFSRNGKLKYRQLPLNGTISFEMDEEKIFLSDAELFGSQFNADLYNARKVERIANYVKERMFREKVLAFLQDGKPKLFKSPTEGNIILRLKDVKTSPNKSLNGLISTFSANGFECCELNEANLRKYKISLYHFDVDDNGIYPVK